MAPTLLEITSAAESLVARQYEWQHNITEPARDYTPFVVSIAMLSVAWSAMALRMYVRGYMIRSIGWDDITMIIALLLFTGEAGADMKLSLVRTDLEFMTYEEILEVVTVWIIVDVFYCVTVTFLKMSVGIFLLRIIIKKHHRWIVYGTITVSTLWGAVMMFLSIFQCGTPVTPAIYTLKRIWGGCVPGPAVVGMTSTLGAVTTMSDFIFTILPIFILQDAQLNKRAKMSLSFILALAGLGSIASIVRFVYIPHLGKVANDFFMNTAKLSIWSSLECGLGIAAGSLATLRPLFRKFLGAARNSISMTKSQLSRVKSRYSYQRHSPRSSVQRGPSIDFGFVKNPFQHVRHVSSDLEIGCRGESPLTPLGMSGVYDGKSTAGSKLGTETTITVGMVQPPHDLRTHQSKRSLSGSRNRGSEMSEWPTGLGLGVIEKNTVFETMSEKCLDQYQDRKDSSSSDNSSSLYSQDTSPKLEKPPRAWL